MSKTIIFTDGASQGNPGPGGWGVIIAHDGEVRELGGREDQTTNNRMELQAVIEALKFLSPEQKEMVIHTDSSYVLQGITKWVKNWSQNNWFTATKKPVLNKDLWIELVDLVEKIDGRIKWKLVAGHAGVPGNERVDTIATAFTENKKVDLFTGFQSEYPINLSSTIATGTKKTKSRTGVAYSYISSVDNTIMIHKSWPECETRVKGVKKAKYKKALSKEEELRIIEEFKKK